MSHRTHHLPPLPGPLGALRELRYHESSRQGLGILLVLLYTITAQPMATLATLGLILAAVGTLFRFWASGYIIKNRELATLGPYAMVRHPLYTGNILIVAGFALANAQWWAIPLALLFFWFYYPPAIDYEDRKLREIFEEKWDHWANGTPALIPTFRKLGDATRGSWSMRTSTKANGEILIVIYLFVCMGVIIWRLG